MKYVVSRIAKRNPAIEGRKLYLTHIYLWTLNVDEARRFDRAGAEAEAKWNDDVGAVAEPEQS